MFEYASAEWHFIRRGASPVDRARLAAISARMHARARGLPVGPPRTTQVALDGGRTRVRLRTDDSVVFEIFGFGAYDIGLDFLGDVRTVMDAGANIGCATLFLAERFPGARFVCVEPAADTFRLLEHNLRTNGVDATCLHAAVTGTRKRVAISAAALPHTRRTSDANGAGGEVVDGLTVQDVLDRGGFESVDLLKLDIEGGESAVFDAVDAWAPRVRCLLAEVHDELTPAAARARLEPAGFAGRPLPDEPQFDNVILMERRR